MTKNSYNGISFCESWKNGNKTFEQFKAEFENVHVFKRLVPKDRLLALKEAFKVATKNKKVEDVVVKDAEKVTKEK